MGYRVKASGEYVLCFWEGSAGIPGAYEIRALDAECDPPEEESLPPQPRPGQGPLIKSLSLSPVQPTCLAAWT